MIGLWGANGFIGSHVSQRFLEESADVQLFARSFSPCPVPNIATASLHCHDFSQAGEYWDKIKDCKTLILMVSASHARTFHDNLAQERQENLIPHTILLNMIETQENNIEHIIYLSSGGTVYGDVGMRAATEKDALNPQSPYGQVKLQIEDAITTHAKKAKWVYTILRVANPVGYWNNNKGIFSALLNAIKHNTAFPIYGDGAAVRDYFDVRDLARAIYICTQNKNAHNQIFNIGSGLGLTIKDVIHRTEQAINKKADVKFITSVDTDVDYNVLNCDKAQNAMQWSAQINIEKTIKDMWAYI